MAPSEEYNKLRHDIDEARAQVGRNGRGAEIQRTLAIMVASLALMATIFSAGVNWGRIETLYTWKDEHTAETVRAHEELVRKDVSAAEFRALRDEIASLRAAIDRFVNK